MFERIIKLFRDDEAATAQRNQAQREALIDLLVWTMFADRHIATAETTQIHDAAEGLAWEGHQSIERFIDAATRRTRDVLGSDRAETAYLDDIHARLADDETRHRALVACDTLISADGDRADAEVAFLARIRARFDATDTTNAAKTTETTDTKTAS